MQPVSELVAVGVRITRPGVLVAIYENRFVLDVATRRLPGEIGFVPRDPRDTRPVDVDVTAELAGGEAFTRRFQVTIPAERISLLDVFLAARCRNPANRMCSAMQSCGERGCESGVITAPPPFFMDAGRDTTADMPSIDDARGDGDDASDVDDTPIAETGDVQSDIVPDTCTGTFRICSGVCVDTQRDMANCGACGNACEPGQGCNGTCTGCPTSSIMCSATRCADLQRSIANCGRCGLRCSTGALCSSGMCVCPPARATTCPSGCADLMTDAANCGACGNACPAGAECSSGACACPAGRMMCGPSCVHVTTDAAHCGGCTMACASGQACNAGVCGAPRSRYAMTRMPAPPLVDVCSMPGAVRPLSLVDDETHVSTLPFDFVYFGTPIRRGAPYAICANGWMSLSDTIVISPTGTIPSNVMPNAVIAAHWADLFTRNDGVCFATDGSAPNRRLLVEWANVRYFGVATGSLRFQVALYEGSHRIEVINGPVVGTVRSGVTGIENASGTSSVSGCMPGSMCALQANMLIRFDPVP